MSIAYEYLKETHIPLLKELGSSMSDCVFLMKVSNGQFYYEFLNEAGYELARLNPKNLGGSLHECLPESEAAFLSEQYHNVLKLQKKTSYHDTVIFPNVQYLAETTLFPLRNDNSQISYILAITKNISVYTMNSPEARYLNRIFSSYIENTEEAFALFDLNWNFLKINESFYRIFGYQKSELYDMNWFDMQVELQPRFQELYSLLEKGEKLKRFDQQLYRKNGEVMMASIGLTAIVDEEGKFIRVVMTLDDITDKVHTKLKLKESEVRYRLIAEYSQDLIKIIDRNGYIQYASPSHYHVIGYYSEEMVGIHYTANVHEGDKEIVQENDLSYLQHTSELRYEVRMRKKNGTYLWVETRLTPVKDKKGYYTKVVASSREITKRKQAEEKLKQMAYTDHLTGLTNRRVFEDQLKMAAQPSSTRKFALLYLDGDQFKQVNDEFGHNFGDELLIMIGERLKSTVRKEDVVARMGGDEFAILLSDVQSYQDIEEVAERIISRIHHPFLIQGYKFSFSCSVGISIYPDDAKQVFQMKKHADLALYEAKKRGKKQHVFYSAITNQNEL
ncbi:diguanylate cyclase domain-containing protein [Halobacillus sp. B23F22_1]|uniref:diguanylate cyclase domain-containing protein n=1 Tax=Halobacillus sp. B23F22_1 TaxID=3459514 RepID=UPI00373F741B